MSTKYKIDIPCKIETVPDYGIIEIIAVIDGRANIEQFEYMTEMYGRINLENSGIVDLDIPSRIAIFKMKFSQNLFNGYLNYEKSRFDTKGTILGKINYKDEALEQTLFDGKVNVYQDYEDKIVDGRLELEPDEIDTVIDGMLKYESDEFYKDFQGKVILDDELNIHVQDLLKGQLYFEENEYEKDICSGRLVMYNHYLQLEFPCRIKVKRKEFIYSVFSTINVVNGFTLELPSRVEVDGTTEVDTYIDGQVTLDKDDYEATLLEGKVDVYPQVLTYIDGQVTLDSTYTRREFNGRVNVVQEAKIEIPCKITVKDRGRVNYINNLLLCRAVLGNKISYTIDSTIHVRNLNPKPEPDIPDLPGVAGGRIVIAVSPTWSYNPFVFKSSLITFLDRYYGIYDFNFVFGGNPRSDWDILNLCNNYKIDKKKLHQVKFRYNPVDPAFNKANIDHFIEHMFMQYPNKEYKNILRVFLFMNQPSWYYNDPLAKIAEVCKMHKISCVAINSGGEYQEITEMDRLRDKMYNTLEIDRQNRMQRDIYHVVSTDIDPRKITF